MSKSLKAVAVVVAIIAIGGAYMFPQVQKMVGAIPGSDLQSDITIGNTPFRAIRQKLVLATTTPCAIKSPSATSTLLSAGVSVTVASSTATVWTIAKAANQYATTTRLAVFSLGSATQGTMVATSSYLGAVPAVDDLQVVAPNSFIVISKAGDTPAGTGLGGTCSAMFQVI